MHTASIFGLLAWISVAAAMAAIAYPLYSDGRDSLRAAAVVEYAEAAAREHFAANCRAGTGTVPYDTSVDLLTRSSIAVYGGTSGQVAFNELADGDLGWAATHVGESGLVAITATSMSTRGTELLQHIGTKRSRIGEYLPGPPATFAWQIQILPMERHQGSAQLHSRTRHTRARCAEQPGSVDLYA